MSSRRRKRFERDNPLQLPQRVELRLCALRPQRREVVDSYRCKTQNSLIAKGYLHVLRGEDCGCPEYEYAVAPTPKGESALAGLLHWLSLAQVQREELVASLQRCRAKLEQLASSTQCVRNHAAGAACAHCLSAGALVELEHHQTTLASFAERSRMLEKLLAKTEVHERRRAEPGGPTMKNIRHMRAKMENRR